MTRVRGRAVALKGAKAIDLHELEKLQGAGVTHAQKLNWGHEPPIPPCLII